VLQLPGQTPGYVQKPAQQQQEPAQQAAQAQPDLSSIVKLLTDALASQGNPAGVENAPQPAANSERPAWLQSSVSEFDINSIQDPIIKSMAGILQSTGAGLDLDRVLGKALAYGDPSLVDVAYLNEKGGANAQQLAEIAKGIVQAVDAKSTAITNEIYQSVGGEAQWEQASAIFNSKAPAEIKAIVAQMLDSTNEVQIKAAAKVVAEFGRSSGLVPQIGAALLNGNPSAGVVGQGLSKVQFQAELAKLNKDAPTYADEREALFARRSLGKSSGLL